MKSLGDIKEYTNHENVLNIAIDQGNLYVQVVNPRTFLLKLRNGQSSPECTTYAVPIEPNPLPFVLTDREDHLLIKSGNSSLKISKFPLRLSFYDGHDQLLSQEDPGLGTIIDDSETTSYRILQPGERFLGLGEKTGPLDRAGKQYRNWNTDAFSYSSETDPLYVSCPFFMGIAHGRVYGIFLNNTSETVFNFGAANDRFSFFQSKAGNFEYYFFAGPDPATILRDYTELTGRSPLPPRWSLGYQQCRYSYRSSNDVKRVAQTFRQKKIPADVIYLDIHYMQDYKVFTWQNDEFPEPENLIHELSALDFRVVPILDPGIKVEDGYAVMESGLEKDVYLKYPDGEAYRGAAWPGWCYFPDFTRKKSREWWIDQMQDIAQMGITGFWNDMNEPAAWGHHTPNILQFDNKGSGGDHKLLRNIYGMEMSRATHEGGQLAHPGERIFVLTRAGFSGSQRYAAIWTGDNYANDEHFLLGCRLLNSMGLSGFSFTGNDVGGFIGEASPALYMRWIAVASFQALMRGHSMINSRDAEPWSFGEEAEQVARNFIRLRYMLLPTLYSLFYEAANSGMPITRSLAFYYYSDRHIFRPEIENQFLFGRDVLVCPMPSDQKLARIYLPDGVWYNFWNDEQKIGSTDLLVDVPFDLIPVYVKAGGILVTTEPGQSTEDNNSNYHIHLYLGDDGSFEFYLDEGNGFAYQNGHYSLWEISLSKNEVTCKNKHHGFANHPNSIRIYFHGFQGYGMTLNGNDIIPSFTDFQVMDNIPNFDPFEAYPNSGKKIENLAFIDAHWGSGDIHLAF